MVEDVKLDLDDDGGKKKPKPPPPTFIYMRWSKVLNKYVECIESDHEAIPYRLAR